MTNDIKDDYLSLDINDLTVNYNKINIAKVNQVSISSLFFITKIEVNNVKTDEALKSFIPGYIKEVEFIYSLLNPLNITINADFGKGNAFANIDLINHKMVINLDVSKSFMNKYNDLKSKFKKNGKYYTYEFKYWF